MKNLFNNLKIWWKNPKQHALVCLVLWLIFFGIMFLIISFATLINKSKNKENFNTNNSLNNNYEYKGEIKINEISYSVSGIRYEDKELIEFNNQTYIIKAGEPLVMKELYNLNLTSLRVDKLIKDLNNNENKTTITYKNNQYKNIYKLNNQNLAITDVNIPNGISNIETIEKNNRIQSITIDASSIFNQIDNNIKTYIITLKYSNINNISDFAVD